MLYAVDSYLNDMWMWSPVSRMWMWLTGANVTGTYGNYGTMGVPSQSNVPGARYLHAMTINTNTGVVYLFGGMGYAATSQGRLNDL